MHVIISASEMDKTICPFSERISKGMIPIAGKPVIQYALDALYRNQEYVSSVTIVSSDGYDISEHIKYMGYDDLFFSKIFLSYSAPNFSDRHLNDLYSGMAYLNRGSCCSCCSDHCGNIMPEPVVFWSDKTLLLNPDRIFDETLGSFIATQDGKDTGVFKFLDFEITTNVLVSMFKVGNSENIFYDFRDFLTQYEKATNEKIPTLDDDFGNIIWDSPSLFYSAQAEILNSKEHEKIELFIDIQKQSVKKTNRLWNAEFSDDTYRKSQEIRRSLYIEGEFLDSCEGEQKNFVPNVIGTGVTIGGNFLDEVTESFIPGRTLDDVFVFENLTEKKMRDILKKVMGTIHDVFQNEPEEMAFRATRILRERYLKALEEEFLRITENLHSRFAPENQEFFVMDCESFCSWKKFVSDTMSKLSKHSGIHDIHFQGEEGILVHGNLTFDSIIFDTFSDRMTFINPSGKKFLLIHRIFDDAALLFSSASGIHSFAKKKYYFDGERIAFPEETRKMMKVCSETIQELSEYPEKLLKRMAVLLALEWVFNHEDPDVCFVLMKHAEQMKRNIERAELSV